MDKAWWAPKKAQTSSVTQLPIGLVLSNQLWIDRSELNEKEGASLHYQVVLPS